MWFWCSQMSMRYTSFKPRKNKTRDPPLASQRQRSSARALIEELGDLIHRQWRVLLLLMSPSHKDVGHHFAARALVLVPLPGWEWNFD